MHHFENEEEAKKRKLGKKCKFNENSGKFLNFVEIGGICNIHNWLRGWTP